ncbi:hypothetical protein [Hydrocarboniphaga sp.]|uniref:hypothetical protein n=1 Tax=Hydrocarboniphaga sp. TaxID=2033016 RepID=UPI0026076F4B|nr:hypothetical protein [Hydrocarboniphaga sp.]
MLSAATLAQAYPYDGYAYTGIRRLDYVAQVYAGTVPGRKLQPGQYLGMDQVFPRWNGTDGKALPPPDADLQARLDQLLAGSGYATYSVALLDLSDVTHPLYAAHNADDKVNVGSVGKVLVVLALMQTLADLYPEDIAARERVLKTTMITADVYSQYDHHTVTFWDPVAKVRKARSIRAGDQGTLWEYLDWMLSASSNSAAGMVQKELIALKHFGSAYPPSPAEYEAFFKQSPKVLGDLYLQTMNDAVARNGFDPEQFRQGSIFTHGGKTKVDGTSSYATSEQLVRYLYRLEAGTLIDAFSSREIKRLLYMTQRRIRYASHPVLNDDAVFFKSGSFYQCTGGGGCPQYKGNKTNRLASVAIVESPDMTPLNVPRLRYLVAVTSNVLGVNSAVAHQSLALKIHRFIEEQHPVPELPPAPPDNAFPSVPVDDPDDPARKQSEQQ